MNDWIPFGFSIAMWITGNGAMGIIWVIGYGLGLIPQNDLPAAMMGIAMLSVVRGMLAESRRSALAKK